MDLLFSSNSMLISLYRRMYSGLRGGLLLIACLSPLVQQAYAAESVLTGEIQVKAAFLFKFVKFIEWPSESFADPDAPICIGIIGEEPLKKVLEDAVLGEIIHGRKLVVQYFRTIEDIKQCQLLFISRSEKGRLAEIISSLDRQPILTVSDIEGFPRNGGAIRLYLEDKKFRFEINPTVAQDHKVKISAQLLQLAKIVGANHDTGRK